MSDVDTFLSDWSDAERNGDGTALATLLTDDFLGVGPLGFVLPKEIWVHRFDQFGLDYETFDLDEVQTRVHGDAALVTARQTARGTARATGSRSGTRHADARRRRRDLATRRHPHELYRRHARGAPAPRCGPLRRTDGCLAQSHNRPRHRQADVGGLPQPHSRAARAHAVGPVPRRPRRQRRLARLHGRARLPGAPLRVPRRRDGVRPDLRAHPHRGGRVLRRSVPAAARRDQPPVRGPGRLLRRPRSTPHGGGHPAVRRDARGRIKHPDGFTG
jgi:ketosteroid isomerase-like protein